MAIAHVLFYLHRQSHTALGPLLHDPICLFTPNEQQIRNCLVSHFAIGPQQRAQCSPLLNFPMLCDKILFSR